MSNPGPGPSSRQYTLQQLLALREVSRNMPCPVALLPENQALIYGDRQAKTTNEVASEPVAQKRKPKPK